jgi:arabinogalactan oligomer/maltooligosaccharide transport system permease protein
MNPSPFRSRAVRLLAILAVTLLALGLRLRAVNLLPIDYDEDDYLAAGQRYAAALRAGDWDRIVNYDFNSEHPPLTKLVYGVSILSLPPGFEIPERPSTDPPVRALPRPHFTVARLTAAAFSTLEVLALALLNPLAALFLGIYTWQIKYTSQIMLEPLPSFTSAVMVLAYVKWRMGNGRRWNGWLALSAVMLGLTAASKYTYCLAALAIVADWLWATLPEKPRTAAAWARWLAPVFGWGVLSLVVFAAFNPRMWNDGLNRLAQSVLYHASYAESEHVRRAGLPMWQPLVWLSGPVARHPGVFLFALDLPIGLLALFGVRRMWRDPQRRVMALWLMLTLAFLLWWNTKWPQYILMLTAPLMAAAAEGFRTLIWEPLTRWRPRPRREPMRWRELVKASPWLLPGLTVLAALVLFPLVYQVAVALTDFNALSIRDGINGGVWREIWAGLTGQTQPVNSQPLTSNVRSLKVSYAGPGLLLGIFSGGSSLFAFEIVWMTLVVGGQVALGVWVALLLARRGARFRGWWRAIFILPVAVPEFVGALIWGNLTMPKYGWISLALGKELNWVPSPEQSLMVLALGAVWMGWPLVMLAASAGLNLISPEVYDAAALDGAGVLARFRFVTWPMLWPLLAPAVIVRAIFAFNQFYIFYTFGYLTQGRLSLTTLAAASYFVFSPTFGGQFAVSAAINLVIIVALVIFIVWFNRWARASEGVEYAS